MQILNIYNIYNFEQIWASRFGRFHGVLALRAALVGSLASGYPLHHPPRKRGRVVPLLSLSLKNAIFYQLSRSKRNNLASSPTRKR